MRPMRFAIVIWMGVVCAVLTGACSEYKPASDTLESVAQANTPRMGNGNWSCLRSDTEPPPLPGVPGARVLYGIRLVDLATGMPFPDVTVRACSLVDPECKAPVTPMLPANADGIVEIPLTENFLGYLEIDSPSAVPYIFHLPDGGLRTMRDFDLAMISRENFEGLSQALGVPLDPVMGAIAVRAFDCGRNPAEGVMLNNSTGGQAWYFDVSLPTLGRTYTDRGGLGGFVNARPGVADFDALLTDGTQLTTKRIIVRQQWMTAGYMRPRGAD